MLRVLWRSHITRTFLTANAGCQYSTAPRVGDSVVVAMSGGVDSSVTASLLSRQSYDLSAVFMRNWDSRDEKASDTGCEWERDWENVQRVCRVLDIPCKMIDLSQQYWTRVFEPALEEWSSGSTPNPDVSCNREIKFGQLMIHTLNTPNKWLATGHYAQISWDNLGTVSRPKLMRSRDSNKDQTYYLSSVSEASLARALFPIGHLTKPEVRDLARTHNLPTASRDESMGICFVGQRQNFGNFLSQYITPRPGRIFDLKGNLLALHDGVHYYTVGQGAKIAGQPRKLYVARKDPSSGDITVVDRNDHPMLMCSSVTMSSWSWIWEHHSQPQLDSGEGLKVTTQIRHRMREVPATLRCTQKQTNTGNIPSASSLELIFDHPQHAVAPGQIAVVWRGPWCLGSGRIGSLKTLDDGGLPP